MRCRKVTIIRNHLIEHAYLKNDLELGGQKDVMSLGDGPIIRSNKGDGPTAERDLGMFVNAREFKEAVHPALERALNAVGGYVNDRESLAAPLEQAK